MAKYVCQSCTRPAVLYCSCTQEFQLICENHSSDHLTKTQGPHVINKITEELKNEQIEEATQAVELIKQAANNAVAQQLDAMNQDVHELLDRIQQRRTAYIKVIREIIREAVRSRRELCDCIHNRWNSIKNGPNQGRSPLEWVRSRIQADSLKKCFADAQDKERAGKLFREGNTRHSHQEYTEAIREYQQSVAIYERLQLAAPQALTLRHLAATFEKKGELASAISTYQRSLKLSRDINSTEEVMITSHALARAYRQAGDYDLATELLNETIEVYRKMNNQLELIPFLKALGTTYKQKEDYNAAKLVYQEVVNIQRALHLETGLAHSLNKLGFLLEMQGLYDDAIKACRESVSLLQKFNLEPAEAISLKTLASALEKKGETDQAILVYEQAKNIQVWHGLDTADTLNKLIEILTKAGGDPTLYQQELDNLNNEV